MGSAAGGLWPWVRSAAEALVLAAVVLAAGCSGGATAGPTDGPPATSPTVTPTTVADPSPTPSPTPFEPPLLPPPTHMAVARAFHTAVRMFDGRMMVVGGNCIDATDKNIAEIYDPATGIWSATGVSTASCWLHASTILADRRVLVAGGEDGERFLASGVVRYRQPGVVPGG